MGRGADRETCLPRGMCVCVCVGVCVCVCVCVHVCTHTCGGWEWLEDIVVDINPI